MAEESGGASWWSSWDKVLDNVKEKSANVYGLVAKDLQEFVSTIQTDTTEVIAETAHVVKEKLEVDEEDQDLGTASLVKQGVSTWLGHVSSSLKEGITKVSNASIQASYQPHSSTSVFDRAKARVEHMQLDPGTYCNDPNGPAEFYNNWCETFNMESHKGEISDLLVNNSKVRALYTNLVPNAVTHNLFWRRYFYKLYQFEEEDKRKAGLMARASQLEQEDLGWDDDDDDIWGSGNTLIAGLPKQHSPTHQSSMIQSAHEQTMDRDIAYSDKDIHRQKQPSKIDSVDKESSETTDKLDHDQNNRTMIMQSEVLSKHSERVKESPEEPNPVPASEQDSSVDNTALDAKETLEGKITEKLEDLKLDTKDVLTPTPGSPVFDNSKEEGAQHTKEKRIDVTKLDEEEDKSQIDAEHLGSAAKTKNVISLSEENSQSDDSGSFVKIAVGSLEQQNSKSDISDDGSWAKLSDEDLVKDEGILKQQADKEFKRDDIASPGSSCMSSPVYVPSVKDKEEGEEEENNVEKENADDANDDDADDMWDEDFDLDEDISDDEVQRIVEAMKNKDPSEIVEDDDWEDWE